MEQGQARLNVEGQGLLCLQEDLRRTGIVARFAGETFEHMCVRIAGEYGIPYVDAQTELENFQ